MATLDELQTAAADAQTAYEAARDRLDTARHAAQQAIAHHAEVQTRFVTGAGTQDDVDQAAAERDAALEALQAIADELCPDATSVLAASPRQR
jgi:outer membrane protein TolC